jgi:antitoxin component YwqK of YwqJK toxin-antitoxin module
LTLGLAVTQCGQTERLPAQRADGPSELYYENGQLWRKVTYKDGELNGLWEDYYENGQLWEKGTYKDGERDGIWEFYKRDGSLNNSRSGYYENGRKVRGL